MSCKIIVLVVGALALASCNTVNKNIGMEDPGLGDAPKYNAAIQTINPDPVYTADSAQPGDNGAKGAAAAKRYRTDAVKQVESMATTGGGGGSPR